jgi:hypothetical protein
MRYELTIHFQRRRHLPGWVHRHGWRLGRRLPHSVTYFQLTAHTEQGKLAEAIEAESGAVVGTVGLVAGAASALIVPTVVPGIEIAEPGKTRLASATRWISVTVLGLVTAQIAKKLLGS